MHEKSNGNVETKIIPPMMEETHLPHSDSPFIMKQMFLPIFTAHIASEVFNFTSFSVISDPNGYETIEWDDEGEYAGGGVPRLIV